MDHQVGFEFNFRSVEDLREYYSVNSTQLHSKIQREYYTPEYYAYVNNLIRTDVGRSELEYPRLLMPYLSNPLFDWKEQEFESLLFKRVTLFNLDRLQKPGQTVAQLNRLTQNNVVSHYIPEADSATLLEQPSAQNKGYCYVEVSSVRAAKLLVLNVILSNIATGSNLIAHPSLTETEMETDINSIRATLFKSAELNIKNKKDIEIYSRIAKTMSETDQAHKDLVIQTKKLSNYRKNVALNQKYNIDFYVNKMQSYGKLFDSKDLNNLKNDEFNANSEESIISSYAEATKDLEYMAMGNDEKYEQTHNKICTTLDSDEDNTKFNKYLMEEYFMDIDTLLSLLESSNISLDKFNNNNHSNNMKSDILNKISKILESNKIKVLNESVYNSKLNEKNSKLKYIQQNKIEQEYSRGRIHSPNSITPKNFGLDSTGYFSHKVTQLGNKNQMHALLKAEIDKMSYLEITNEIVKLKKNKTSYLIKLLEHEGINETKVELTLNILYSKLMNSSDVDHTHDHEYINSTIQKVRTQEDKTTELAYVKLVEKLGSEFIDYNTSIYNMDYINSQNFIKFKDIYDLNNTDSLDSQNNGNGNGTELYDFDWATFSKIINRFRYDTERTDLNLALKESDLNGIRTMIVNENDNLTENNDSGNTIKTVNYVNFNSRADGQFSGSPSNLKIFNMVPSKSREVLVDDYNKNNGEFVQEDEHWQSELLEQVSAGNNNNYYQTMFVKTSLEHRDLQNYSKANDLALTTEYKHQDFINEYNSEWNGRNLGNRLYFLDHSHRGTFETLYDQNLSGDKLSITDIDFSAEDFKYLSDSDDENCTDGKREREEEDINVNARIYHALKREQIVCNLEN